MSEAMQATPHNKLIEEIMDCRIAKNEHGWAAAKEIEQLRKLATVMFNEKLKIAVCVAGAPPFISAVNGKVILEVLVDIEHQLIDDELVDGFYVFTATHYIAETGEFGRIEIPAYWELDQVSFKALKQ